MKQIRSRLRTTCTPHSIGTFPCSKEQPRQIMGVFRRFFCNAVRIIFSDIPNLGTFYRSETKNGTFQRPLQIPEAANLILGQSHFIKIAKTCTRSSSIRSPAPNLPSRSMSFWSLLNPGREYDDELRNAAVANALSIGAGHVSRRLIRQAYPINAQRRVRIVSRSCPLSVPRQIRSRPSSLNPNADAACWA